VIIYESLFAFKLFVPVSYRAEAATINSLRPTSPPFRLHSLARSTQ